MSAPQVIPLPAVSDPESQSPEPPQLPRYKLIIDHCIVYTVPTILGIPMLIFLAIPTGMPPEFRVNLGSSLSSLNISSSHVTAQWNIALSIKNPSHLIAIWFTHMKLLLSFNGEVPLSSPSFVPAFTQGPNNVTMVRAEALSTLAIVNDWGVKGRVSTLIGGMVTIDVFAEAKRRLPFGPWRVAVFDVYFSCMDVTFTAPTNSKVAAIG